MKPTVHRIAPLIIARLTISRADGKRTIVEIHQDATFHQFYRFFTQDGRRYSTKTLVRTASRNTYLPAINTHRHQPGLDVVSRQLESLFAKSNPVVSTKIRIIRKRVYKRLISVSPDQLGLSKVSAGLIGRQAPTLYPRLIGKAIRSDKWTWPASMDIKVGVR
jgi:hypothetical protein